MTDKQANDPALWWKQAVVYQVYPRSFKDSTGTGLGDLNGVTEKIPYLKRLGVDAIWLNPFYPSHMADAGYDVDDYRDVDPLFGTMDDFSRLTKTAHEAGIKVVIDIVPNHTSNQHEWFKAALAAGPGSPERDRYIFRDGKGPNGDIPPTNWESHFGDPAWKRVPDGQWYLHMFAEEQPDLNWKNPEVHEDFKKTFRFWLDHGVDGFRIDVAQGLGKDLDRDDLDNYHVWCDNTLPDDGSHPVIDRNESHEIYKEWRREVFNQYDPPTFAVAEAMVNPKRLHLYASTDELGQTFNFEFAKKNWLRDEFHTAIEEGLAAAREAKSSATWVMSNHDMIRQTTRYGLPQVKSAEHHQLPLDWLLRNGETYAEDRELGTKRARAAILMELALPGSAYVYQGEELGLFEVADIPWEKLEDPWAFNSTRATAKKGRDGCRVPLPWDSTDAPKLADESDEFGAGGSFGFSPAAKADGSAADEPHLPQPRWFKDLAVDVQDADPDSTLNLYRAALALRHEYRNEDTDVEWLPEDRASDVPDGANGYPGGVIAYRRSNGWASLTNFGAEPIDLPAGEVLLASAPLTEDGRLPQDVGVWMKLD
ncbi:alpha-amylase [Bifidobacterium sp. SMB2]|uniref:Alpha-amylase n=1 Tax=Bifidobacterium saimiriisciurei TaxID=2661627 RepID=A0ABX0CAP2_9BIFI|nr:MULTISPECIES: glycoside hydrolase family 13 protein [Bifidobacterium]NEG95192.1 alpha-amylase [Bifidobacterium sp. SMB2]NEH11269.1 alpha-amylase [Bifidobacterium saimiriisciurei]